MPLPWQRLQTHRHQKSYLEEQQTKTDRSTLGLYFANAPSSEQEIQSFAIPGSPTGSAPGADPKFSSTFDRGGRLLALRPSVDQPYASMTIDAVSGGGARTPLLKLRGIRPEWPRRYWLVDPIELPAGTTIEVSAIAGDPDAGPLAAPVKRPLAVALDYVPE